MGYLTKKYILPKKWQGTQIVAIWKALASLPSVTLDLEDLSETNSLA